MFTDEVIESIAAIVNYNWDGEAEDYERWKESGDADGMPEDAHIFFHLNRVSNALELL